VSSDDSEREDLQALLASAGFARMRAFVEQSWGAEACIAKIDTALTNLRPGDEDGERMTVLQIRAASRQIQGLMRWPQERLNALTAAAAEKPSPLQRLRRIGG
jgi:hypothetical protein